MTGRRLARFTAGVALCASLVLRWSAAPSAQGALLDVPFLAQSPELCGGAAAAMVLRYWGTADVQANDFGSLVDPATHGIPTGALATAVKARGWTTLVTTADTANGLDDATSQIARGRPVIALVRVADHRYHYVVLLAVTSRDVVLHDPSQGAFRVVHRDEFDRQWAPTSRWALVILPADAQASRPAPVRSPDPPSQPDARRSNAPAPCDQLVDISVAQARAGETETAEAGLLAAEQICPDAAAPRRELAGLRFRQSRWPEARDLAAEAVARDGEDANAWEILGASRYLSGDLIGALHAWNRIEEPHVEGIDVHGAHHTRASLITGLIGIEPRQELTAGAFQIGARRLDELPASSSTRLRYQALAGDEARLDAAIVEQPLFGLGWMRVVDVGARGVVGHDLRLEFANLVGQGELWSADWRWSRRRPLLEGRLDLPSPGWWHGVASLDVLGASQDYAVTDGIVRESRRRVALDLADWATGNLRWDGGVALDRFDTVDHVAVRAGLDRRLFADHVSLYGTASWWSPNFRAAEVILAARSTTKPAAGGLTFFAASSVVSDNAPRALWDGAGTGEGYEALLRAHPIVRNDIVSGPAFGRTLTHATVEYAVPVARRPAGSLLIAAFADAAKASRRLTEPSTSPTFVDVGMGVRLQGATWRGAVRLDFAYGLTDRAKAISAGWTLPWPR